MDKYIITITRQFGSLGRPIAKKMSEKLGIAYYDRDIVDEAAKKLSLPVSVVDDNEEWANVINDSFIRMAYPLGRNTTEVQDQIFATQQNIIGFLAEKESCIVVGRCADYMFIDNPNVINIYIYASYEARIKNSIEKLNLSEAEAKRIIKEVDEARDAYHMHYAGYKPDDKRFKQIMIDSSFLGIEETADYLVELIKMKVRA